MVVHGTYLARDSDYFKAALKKDWIEGQTRTIVLVEECPEIMAQYINFTYARTLSSEDKMYKETSDFKSIYQLLATLYVYGERFINPTIQKAVIKENFRNVDLIDARGDMWCPSKNSVNIIYRGTPENSPARRLMVDLHLSYGDKSRIREDLEPAFLADLAKAFFDRSTETDKSHPENPLKFKNYI
jgi:hypothetical protein